MAQTAYPFGDQGVTDAQYRRYARTAFGTKIHEGLTVSANSTGMQVQVADGFATVQGLAFYNDSTASVSIGANAAAYPRVDTVVLRLDYTATPQIQLAVVQGTPRSNPVAATLTQTDLGVFEFPLADVTVAASAVTIASSNVSNRTVTAYRWINGAMKAVAGRLTPYGAWTEQDALRWNLVGENMILLSGTLKSPSSWTSGWNPAANDKVLNLPYPALDWGWPPVVSTNDYAICTLNFSTGLSTAYLRGTTRNTTWSGTGYLFNINGATYVPDLS